MPFQVSPGVNVSEIDLTTVVPAVSTTEGAIAGQFEKGPVNQRILIDSEDRLVSVFGKPNADNASDWFTAANFLAYGNALYVVRVTSSDALNAATTTAALVKNEEDYEENYSRNDNTWIAKTPGAEGNSLKVSICPSANAWQETTSLGYTITRNTNTLTINGAANTSVWNTISKGDILLIGSDKVQGQVKAISQGANSSTTTVTLESTYRGSTVSANTGSLVRRWEYFNLFDTAPTTTAYANTVGGQGDEIHMVVVDEDGDITGTKGNVIESFGNVSVASDAKTEQGATNYYKDVVNQRSSYVYWGGAHAAGLTNAGTAAKDTTFNSTSAVVTASLVSGSDGSAIDADDKIVGYDYFKSAEDVDISLILGGSADQTLATHLITNIAESRKDCVVVISPERADVVNNNSYEGAARDDVIAYRDLLPSSSYAVMDSAWKYQYDKYNDLYRYVPLNGDTAGLMVQTDLTRDPWYSPAGFNRGNVKNVIKLSYNPSKGDRDQLYKKGINPVVTFPGQGTVLFGDKTMLAQPSAFDRINVRRLFIVLEKAISTASKFTLFEFNDEFTRSQFKNLVEPFLRDVQGRRGITDFVVVCDGTNNTGEVIDRNEFIGDIYIKPARSINFIQLNFVAVRTGVEFSEIIGNFG
jgi:phage tail sheath protein FI